MENKVVTLPVYSFVDLPAKVQEKLIDREIENIGGDFDDFYVSELIEQWKEKLDQIGFEEAKIYYSIYGGQGSGACFSARCDFDKLCEHLKMVVDDKFDLEASLSKINYHYNHENTYKFNCCIKVEGVELEQLSDVYETAIDNLKDSLCKQLHKELEALYDDCVNRETVRQNLEEAGNKYVLTSDVEKQIGDCVLV